MPVSSPTPGVTPSPAVVPTAEASPTVRVVDLRAILEVTQADRFETFGDHPIHLESVWSPPDLGLGGTCTPGVTFFDCGLADWLIRPSQNYDGTLKVFSAPGVREGLGRDLRPDEGPFDVVGHFGDPASQECRPERRELCRDRFMVTAVVLDV